MKNMNKLKIIDAKNMSEGEGASVKRGFPTNQLMNVDPFVLIDEFTVKPSAGFPEHPHRGFEALTYMLEGSFIHKDSSGNEATVEEGGLQRITMGKGVKHSEMPGSDKISHGIQLWVNLPKKLKKIEPDYQIVPKDKIPVKEENGKTIKTVVGKGNPTEVKTEIKYEHIELDGTDIQRKFEADHNGLIYVIDGEGSIEVDKEVFKVVSGNLIFNDDEEKLILDIEADMELEFVFIAGKPHKEPINQHGSFVD